MNLQELQAMKSLIRDVISYNEDQLKWTTDYIREQYALAEPDTQDGVDSFKLLNQFQNEKRKIKRKLKKLRNLQVSLKKEIKDEVSFQRIEKEFTMNLIESNKDFFAEWKI
jgi:hypothetical protein